MISFLLSPAESPALCTGNSICTPPLQISALETIDRSGLHLNGFQTTARPQGRGSFLSRLFRILESPLDREDFLARDHFGQIRGDGGLPLLQRVAQVFRRYPALGGLLNYLDNEPMTLLTTERILKILRHSQYAEEILKAIKILSEAGIASEKRLSFLIEHGEHAEDIAIAIRTLHHRSSLADYSSVLLTHPVTLARGIRILEERGLLDQHLQILIENPMEAPLLAAAICRLHRAGLPNSLLSRLISSLHHLRRFAENRSSLPTIQEALTRLIPHASSLAEAIRLLDREELQIDEHLHFLTQTPEHAPHLARGMIVLNHYDLLSPNRISILARSPQYAPNFAEALHVLNSFQQLPQDFDFQSPLFSNTPDRREENAPFQFVSRFNWFYSHLTQRPEHAPSLATGLCTLFETNDLGGTEIQILIQYPEEAPFLADAIGALKSLKRIEQFYDLLKREPKKALTLAKAVSILKELDRAYNKPFIDELFRNPEHAESMARGYSVLVEESINYRPAYNALVQFPEHALHLAEAIAHLHSNRLLSRERVDMFLKSPQNAMSLAEGAVRLHQSPAFKHYDSLLLRFPKQARSIGGAIATLAHSNLPIDVFLETLCAYPEYAVHLAEGFVILHRRHILSPEHMNALTQRPEHAAYLATAIALADPTNRPLEDMINHSEHAVSLALLSKLQLKPRVFNAYREALVENPSLTPLDREIANLHRSNILDLTTLSFLMAGAPTEVETRGKLIDLFNRMRRLKVEHLNRLRVHSVHLGQLLRGFLNYASLGALIPRNNNRTPIDEFSFNLLFDHAPYAEDLSWSIQYLRRASLLNLASLNQITSGGGAHARALHSYFENSNRAITQERFDSIMMNVWGRARLAATLLPHWHPIPTTSTHSFSLPADLILHIASFLMPVYDPPYVLYSRDLAALRVKESAEPKLRGRRFGASGKHSSSKPDSFKHI